MNYRTVPDSLRDREPVKRGRSPSNDLSKRLLKGQTIFIEGKNNFGSIYTLAKNNGKQARTKKTTINEVEGTLIWLEEGDDRV
jgi:hypothetical protein